MRRIERSMEERFLVLSARVKVADEERAELERLIAEDLDWKYIFFRSREEGLSAFIHHHIKRLPAHSNIPEYVKEWARQAYFQNLARNTGLAASIREISEALGAEKIAVLALKGSYLAEHIYKDISLRPVGDLDIVVRKSDLQKANDVLAGLGYAEPLNIKETVAFKGVAPFNSLMYSRKKDIFFIHLHWHLINSTWPLESYVRKMDMERVWANSGSVMIDQAPVRALSPEHQIIYLVNHGLHHSFSKLIMCADVREALITFGPRLDPDKLKTEARRFGIEDILKEGLSTAGYMLSCDICRNAAGWFGERWARTRRGYCRSYRIYFFGDKGISNKARFLYSTLFPQPIVLANSMNIPLKSLISSKYRYYVNIINRIMSKTT